MKHKLSDITRDFPWTKVTYNGVEPWRDKGTGWFDFDIPQGWADVIYHYMIKLDAILKKYNLVDNIIIEQVKEKFGGLRMYFIIPPHFNDDIEDYDEEFTEEQHKAIEWFQDIVWEMEEATEKVCCDCGTTEDIQCYGGWVHFACPNCEAKRVAEWKETIAEWEKVHGKIKTEDRKENEVS